MDEFIEKRADVNQWHVWNNSGRRPEGLPPLLDAYNPLIQKEVNRWAKSGLPRVALESEARRIAADAFHSYQPGKAMLTTHLTTRLKGLNRYVNTYANDVRVPEERVSLFNKVFRAKQELSLDLGRDPTNDEIAAHTGIGKNTVGSLHKFQSRLYSQVQGSGFDMPAREDLSHDRIAMEFLHHDLTPQQQIVLEHLTGFNGKPVLGPGEIAKKIGVSGARVSTIRNEIAEKAHRYQMAVNSLVGG